MSWKHAASAPLPSPPFRRRPNPPCFRTCPPAGSRSSGYGMRGRRWGARPRQARDERSSPQAGRPPRACALFARPAHLGHLKVDVAANVEVDEVGKGGVRHCMRWGRPCRGRAGELWMLSSEARPMVNVQCPQTATRNVRTQARHSSTPSRLCAHAIAFTHHKASPPSPNTMVSASTFQ